MAYISQTDKKTLAPAIKAVFKKYGLKGTISIRHHSVLCANVSAGRLDLIGAADQIGGRPYNNHYQANAYAATNEKYKDIRWLRENSAIWTVVTWEPHSRKEEARLCGSPQLCGSNSYTVHFTFDVLALIPNWAS